MSGENGDKSQRQTSEEIGHHIDVILLAFISPAPRS